MSASQPFPNDLCVLYREANLRFPQAEVGIVPMIADLALRSGTEYLAVALTAEFSPQQVASIEDGMNRGHLPRRIPALSPDYISRLKQRRDGESAESFAAIRVITPERIRLVWRNIVVYTLDALRDCIVVAYPLAPLPEASCSADYERLRIAIPALLAREPAVFAEVSGMFASVVRTLDCDEARKLAHAFRASLDFTDVQSGRKASLRSRRELHESLADLMAQRLQAEHPKFVPLVATRAWKIFRPMIECG
jgi:hypothetical protein